jgi:hypothetical protein
MGRALAVIVPVMVMSLLAGPAVVAQLDGGPPLFAHVAGSGPVLIHYWNFDTIPNDVDLPRTSKELLDAASRRYGAFLSYSGGRWDRVNDPTAINNREAPYDPMLDRALRLRNPVGALTLDLPTTGYRDVQLRYAVNRTPANGAERQQIAYSLDGGKTFTTAGLSTTEITVKPEAWTMAEIDFSGVKGANDNANFVVRLTMAGAGSDPNNTAGNQRINNLTLDGYAIPSTESRSLIHYWDFDSIPNDVNFPTGEAIAAGGTLGGKSTVSGAWLRYDGARWDRVNDPTHLNARATPYRADDDRAIRMRNPSGSITWRLPTTGHTDAVVKFAVKKSGRGAARQEIAYSVDGSKFVTTGLPYTTAQIGENWVLHTLDFSNVAAVDNKPNFTIRITPAGPGSEPANVEGNQRFDHISAEARPATRATVPSAPTK